MTLFCKSKQKLKLKIDTAMGQVCKLYLNNEKLVLSTINIIITELLEISVYKLY